MIRQTNNHSMQEQESNSSQLSEDVSARTSFLPPNIKSAIDWEKPDFDELDLCMEITTYILNGQ
ncbi:MULTISPECIES: pyrroloquinoline quinone precursor peptide PqqA [unclassified Nostoc]|uniref:pyrroloquinoline quinone precursor peptide PqqA n=1 Tax=unclassified Nostoc TaxID=2593658 RepID=UPI002AD35903|nr:pyrroloquinoline quinone precursor peptide PqqA [Nostoc sp. DedQUE03]MDZ7971145.1 pyrroloquinoline quinone precursor peptide PqqA [Nostoc sp. DedQUE03]MDZ8046606.1 pyrroloquinoline quinone precursor peptide PqqA [Nostoc sp. DedQUE02]